MKGERATAAFKSRAARFRPPPLAITAARRLFGLNAGDWSMIGLGLLLSGLLMAFV